MLETIAKADATDFRNAFDQEVPEGLDQPKLFRLFVMPLKTPTKTKGGIMLPDSVQEGNNWSQSLGRIAAVGPYVCCNRNYRDLNFDFEQHGPKIGELVMFSAHQPQRFKFKGVNLVIVNDDAILIGPIKEENIEHYVFGRFGQIDMGGGY